MSSVASFPCDTAILESARASAPGAPGAEPWILATTILASSMAFIDGTVVNVALPAVQATFGATLGEAQWVIEAYELMLAALLLVGGAAGDRFGRRRVFVIGVVMFTLASIACGVANSVGFLIVARGLQGVGGALLVPGSLAVLSASFDEAQRGRAIGTWSGFTAITTALGPVLGGFLLDHGSWRYAFFINVPIALVVLALTLRHVPESRSESAGGPIDGWGAALAAIGLGSIVYALIEAQTVGFAARPVWGSLAIGALALAVFLAVEWRHSAPMLPLALFRSSDFSGTNLLTLLLYAALSGSLFFLPLDLIQVQGYSALAAGAALLPFVLLMFALSRWAGGLVARYGAKLPLVVGPVVAACGFALFALPASGGSYWTTFFPAAVVLGLGMTVTVAPLTTTVMQSVSKDAVGAASGVNNAVSSVGGLLAIAGLGMAMALTFNTELHRGLQTADVPTDIVTSVESQRARLASLEPPARASAEVRASIEHVVAQAFVSGFRLVMWIAAALALASAVTAWLFIGREAPPASRD
ncbi:MAG TPA: MFS transporter [Casimicrobiaceae bacterium]|nr:MFS transporter [Casimicrobiaceae bacterium]